MDLVVALQAALLGLVEGLTEFLPISSTGHLIVFSDLLNFNRVAFFTPFVIVIQLGSILSVVWLYRHRIAQVVRGLPSQHKERHFALNVLLAFLPALVLGPLLAETIEHTLFNPLIVASMLVLGGVILIYAEKRKHRIRVHSMDELSWRDAIAVGLCQCLALVPGTSRSGATIIGGLLFGFSRKTATEFSFFLAIPTMVGATTYALCRHYSEISSNGIWMIVLGFCVSFVVALITVRGLLDFIGRHTYIGFGVYRIIFGLFILATWLVGIIDWAQPL